MSIPQFLAFATMVHAQAQKIFTQIQESHGIGNEQQKGG